MDLSFITNFFNDVILFIQYIIDFVFVGLYLILTDLIVFLTKHLMLLVFNLAIILVTFIWDVGNGLMNELNLSQELSDAYGGFDSEILYYLTVLRVPECINNLLTGLATHFILSLIPGR